MTRIIMCGCNGAMGRMITGIVNEDAEAEIVAGIDMVDTKEHCYPVFQKLADCDVEADALIDFSTPKILDDILTFSKEKKVPVVLCTTGYIIGIVIPTPVNASEPTSGIRPINILSTILYKALTNIPIIAGIEYFNKSFPIDSSPK